MLALVLLFFCSFSPLIVSTSPSRETAMSLASTPGQLRLHGDGVLALAHVECRSPVAQRRHLGPWRLEEPFEQPVHLARESGSTPGHGVNARIVVPPSMGFLPRVFDGARELQGDGHGEGSRSHGVRPRAGSRAWRWCPALGRRAPQRRRASRGTAGSITLRFRSTEAWHPSCHGYSPSMLRSESAAGPAATGNPPFRRSSR